MDWICFKFDGIIQAESSARFDGLFRDYHSNWLGDYAKNIGKYNSVVVEL